MILPYFNYILKSDIYLNLYFQNILK